jgi:streptogramin lyase
MEGKEIQAASAKNRLYGYSPGAKKPDLAAYLASTNMSSGRGLPSEFKTLPRPTGKATRVIVTQYDMPRKDTVPHDSDVDWDGNVWYTDQSDYFVGRLDAKTGTFKEWALPKASTHAFGGASDVTIDRKNRPWFSVTVDKLASNFGVPGRFDPQKGLWTPVAIEKPRFSQFNALAPDGAIVQGNLKIDTETMQLLDEFEWEKSPNPPPGGPFQGRDAHIGYEPAMDSKGNWYLTDFAGGYIIQVEAKTKKVNWYKTPSPASQPRRGRIDSQDRFWFAEYTADKIAMFDAKTSKITEWDTGLKWSGPYTSSVPDAKGRVYAPSSATDRVFQLNPTTGEVVAFLMPTRDFDTKQMSIDPVNKRAVWLANVRNARIIRIEPLD